MMRGRILSGILVGIMSIGSLFYCAPVMAVSNLNDEQVCQDPNIDATTKKAMGCEESGSAFEVAQRIINVIIALVGIIAVGAIIVCAILMMTAVGDANRVARAKKGILYAIVGLVICVLAYAIVNFVLASAFAPTGGE